MRWPFTLVVLVVAVGALATTGLTILSARLASSNEQHLLNLRSKEVASALTSTLPDIRTPLGAAATLADLTGVDSPKLAQFAAPYVGRGREFVSMSIWLIGHLGSGPLQVVGAAPELPSARGGALPVLRGAAVRSGLTVRGLLHVLQPRIAYAYTGSQKGPYIVEAEQALPTSRFARLPADSAYSNVNVAVYIARSPRASRLLLRTVHRLPLPGPHAMTRAPFGSETLAVVVSARQPLGGALPERMPWVIAVLGFLLTAGAGALTLDLVLGRRRAQRLASENRRLYAEQRGIAQSLQHALLPEGLPEIHGVRLAGLYDAGMPGIEVGGDWYDLIQLRGGTFLLVVGDVSGRGIRAATAMASVRSAIQYAAPTDAPEVFLPKLSAMPALREHGLLATVLCMTIDLQTRQVKVTSAGHLPPLMVHDGRAEFLRPEVGVPIGIETHFTYVASTFELPDRATLLAFTDGLVERHDETLDEGLERLRQAACEADGDLEQMMAQILERVRGPASIDDTALAGIQWVGVTQQFVASREPSSVTVATQQPVGQHPDGQAQ